MFFTFQTFNNITAHKLFIIYYKMLLDYYCYQINNNFKKLLEQKNAKNISKITIPTF